MWRVPRSLRLLAPSPSERLKEKLDVIAVRYDGRFVDTDPVKFVHRYTDPVPTTPPVRPLAQALRRHGTLGRLFAKSVTPGDAHVGPALSRFVEEILAGDPRPFFPSGTLPQRSPVRFLLSSPEDGSACKRMLLYLRWMVRPADGVDVGAWAGAASPAQLLIPLDTHTFRITRYLGLTARKQGDWRAAEEVTAGLARLRPEDPVRYDFALCRLGILDLCPAKRDEKKCVPCDLYDVCRL